MRSRWELFLTTCVGLLVAVAGFLGLLLSEHLWQDHQTYHLLLGLVNYNLQQGKLVPMQPLTPPAPTPTPSPPAK